MLTTYQSNRMEILADRLAELIGGRPQRSPLAPDYIIVQSNGMARWLSLHLARRLGICANVRFPFPGVFLWDTFRQVLQNVPETSPSEPAVLAWRVMALLQSLENNACFAPLTDYLQDGDDFRRYELAYRIACNYDQYLLYRPDWIARWEAGEENHWQAELWRRLAAGRRDHRVHIQRRFVDALKTTPSTRLALPERISLIGLSALPPAYLDILGQLAQATDIHLFLLNPCREYWGDIAAERDIARLGAEVDADQEYLTVGNYLLASLGRQGRDFIDLVLNHAADLREDFQDPPEDSLLHCLQADILNLSNRGGDSFPPLPVRPDDNSIQVHACHSPMREVEVLHDQLLALFQNNPELEPADILVMTPDLVTYGPVIEAVFATVDGERYIPFSLADQDSRIEHPLLDVFFQLLDLRGSRFDVNRVLDLLETPALRRRFGFVEEDLPRVQRWLRDTGIRWGIDSDSRAALDLPATREHTWQAGLERLLLGYALPGGNSRMLADILPYDDVEGGGALAMGQLQAFADALFRLDRALAERHSPAGWTAALRRVLEEFFEAGDSREEEQLQRLRRALEALAQTGALAGFAEPVPLAVAKAGLGRLLDTGEGGSGRFLTGGVTFCTMAPMRSLPFQVVCLIGLNDGVYPRPHQSVDFDLMTRYPRRGDRSRRRDDRYLFLEALLGARRCLYLSYVGSDIRDNTVIPPSLLVSELLEAIERGFYSTDGGPLRDRLLTRHPLQPYSRHYFNGDGRLFSYSRTFAEAARLAGRGERMPAPFIATTLPPADQEWRTVELARLIRFFANPTRYLLRERLGIHLEEGEGLLEAREPFILDPLAGYRLRETLLTLHRNGMPAADILPVLKGNGMLPHGRVGECLFERERHEVEAFAERLERVLPNTHQEPLELDLSLGDMRLTGRLTGLSSKGLVGYRLAKVRPRDYLEIWIRHLLLNRLAPAGVRPTSHWLGRDRDVILEPLADPEPILRSLLDCYWQGLHRPLHFFPKSAFAYADAVTGGKPRTYAEALARREWEGGEYQPGESEDLYYERAFRGVDPLDGEFARLAELIFGPLLRARVI